MIRCSLCGAVHSLREWLQDLEFVGIMRDGEWVIELRNCWCGTTLARDLSGGAG